MSIAKWPFAAVSRAYARITAVLPAVWAEAAILAAAFLLMGSLRVATFELDFDHTVMLATAVNFFDGGEIGLLTVKHDDMSTIGQGRLAHWPPGWAMIVCAFLAFDLSVYAAVILSDLASLALVLSACLFILARMRNVLPRVSRILIALTVGITGPPYIEFFANTWSLGLYLWGVALLLPRSDGTEPRPLRCAAAGILFSFTVLLRYAYGPAALVPVLAMAALGWRTKDGRIRALATAGGWAVGIAPFLAWKFLYVGHVAVKPLNFDGKLYFANLARFHPFATDSLFGWRLSWTFPLSEYKFKWAVTPAYFIARHALSSVILVLATLGVRSALISERSAGGKNVLSRFFVLGACAVAANVAFLVALSLVHRPDEHLWGWVYCEEPRYFAVCHPFILVGAAYTASWLGERGWRRFAAGASLFIFTLAAGVWVASLPFEWKHAKAGRFGGPIDRYYPDGGSFSRILSLIDDPRGSLISVEVGEIQFDSWLRRHVATIARVPSGGIREAGKLVTKKPVNILLYAARDQDEATLKLLDDSCREVGGLPFDMGAFRLCRGVLTPAE